MRFQPTSSNRDAGISSSETGVQLDDVATLAIEVNPRQAMIGASVLGAITSVLYGWILLLALYGRFEGGGPLAWTLGGLVLGWLFVTLINSSWQLVRLSRSRGPILVITPKGLEDHWRKRPRMLRWRDIQYCGWRNAAYARSFRVVPKRRSFADVLGGFFGSLRLRYPERYLSVPADEISQFLTDHAPTEVLR